MNRNDFLGMIQSNGPSDRHSIGEIKELLRVFPYCQSAHILLLKGLKNTSDVKFENQLKISALHIADREVLYYFLQKEQGPGPDADIQKQKQHVTLRDDTEHEQTVIEAARNSVDLIAVIEKGEKPSVDDEGDADNAMIQVHHEIIKEETVSESAASVLVIDEESGEVEEKVIYMDPGFSSYSDDEDLLELESEEPGAYQIDRQSEISSEPAFISNTDTESSKRKTQADLIDKFIEANPRIEPVRVRPDAPIEDIALPSTEHKEGFVTETLARIYISQGYYSRAIDIYERLSLKFPEKSSYFATQIEKVKDLIKK